jgi:hypothetical protein
MDITIGHWIYAIIGTGLYILFLIWAYKKEIGISKTFNFKPIPILIYTILIVLFIYFTS